MIALALLALVFARHYMPAQIAGAYGLHEGAWFYVFGGYQEALLWLLLLGWVTEKHQGWQRRMAALACCWGAAEGLMMGGCRIGLAAMGKTPADIPRSAGACDVVFDAALYPKAVLFILLCMVWVFWKKRETKR